MLEIFPLGSFKRITEGAFFDCLLWMQYFVEAKAIALRRVSKEDMRHIAKATGATQVHIVLFSSFICILNLVRILFLTFHCYYSS